MGFSCRRRKKVSLAMVSPNTLLGRIARITGGLTIVDLLKEGT
jgi:hypothetical protein